MIALVLSSRANEVRVVDEDATTVWLGWDPIDCDGYRFVTTLPSNVVTSHTWDGSRTTLRVSKSATHVSIEPFRFDLPPLTYGE